MTRQKNVAFCAYVRATPSINELKLLPVAESINPWRSSLL
jgi:hypothetical protein